MIHISRFFSLTLKTIRCWTLNMKLDLGLQQHSWFCPNIVVKTTALSRPENTIILGTMRFGDLTSLTTKFCSFWVVTPCSLVEASMFHSCLASSSTQKTTETSVIFYRVVRCYILENDSIHHNRNSLFCD